MALKFNTESLKQEDSNRNVPLRHAASEVGAHLSDLCEHYCTRKSSDCDWRVRACADKYCSDELSALNDYCSNIFLELQPNVAKDKSKKGEILLAIALKIDFESAKK